MRRALALALTCLLVGCSGHGGPAVQRVVLVTIDTLRADHLGCYGAQGNPTPRIDGLAAEGAVFDDASTPVPITLPAHASLLTGVSPPIHGVRDNASFRLGPERPTMAELLSRAGFDSGAFVGSVVLDAAFGLGRGFSSYDDAIDVPVEKDPDRAFADRPAEAVVDAALAWLQERKAGKRFFLWVHLYDPHAPYDPPPPYRESHGRTYEGEIAYTDHQVGRLLDGLEGLGLAGDTLTVLTADHGEGLGEHGETTHGFFLYQSTVHVPLILRLPGRIPAGRRVAAPVDLLDLMPTVLDAAGLEHPVELEGKSLFGAATGEEAAPQRSHYLETFLPYYSMRWSGSRGLREGKWKYIDSPEPELYDLETDPRETKNLHETEPERDSELRSHLLARARWMGALRRTEGEAPAAGAETRRRIRSLGYLPGVVDTGGDLAGRAFDRPDTKNRIHLVDALQAAVPLALDRKDPAALARLRQLSAEDPDNPRILTILAQALQSRGDYQSALPLLRRVVELEPDSVRAHGNVALILLELGLRPEAETALARALELDDGNPPRRRFLAELLLEMHRPAEAVEWFGKVLATNPNDRAAQAGLERAQAAMTAAP